MEELLGSHGALLLIQLLILPAIGYFINRKDKKIDGQDKKIEELRKEVVEQGKEISALKAQQQSDDDKFESIKQDVHGLYKKLDEIYKLLITK